MMWGQFLRNECLIYFMLFANVAKLDITMTLITSGYIHFGARYLVYDRGEPVPQIVIYFLGDALFFIICPAIVIIFINWVGFKFLEAELPR
mmetsp:Transcript_25398/g.31782  ORF Transcript_25398/g.31782 Transcript_25398/m.31782 type:complete len:91 (+) Transcript_25398:447-719(+)